MKNLYIALFILFSASAYSQYVVFDELIDVEDFESTEITLPPSPLTTQIVFVGGHDIVQTTKTYGNPQGRAIAKEWHDFIGWTPDDSGESMGWVTVNHEMIYEDDRIGDGGGMTTFRVTTDANGELEILDQTLSDGRSGKFFNVDFVNTVGETGMNCAGISAPNGRIWTAEEWFRSNTASIYNGNFVPASRPDLWNPHSPALTNEGYGVRDTSEFTINAPEFPLVDGMTIPKYENFNYMVEIDPKEAVAIRKQYNWGRAGWEGGAISADGMYVYLGMDSSPAPWIRITASTPWDFVNDVKVEAYKENNAPGEQWVEMEQNVDNVFGDLINSAWEAGATMFMRNEWVTIDHTSGIVYWTETGRDGSSGAGVRFAGVNANYPNALPAQFHEEIAQERFGVNAMDPAYQDYYGRVWYYDPATEEIGVMVDGGPYFESSPGIADYPEKHLSNPDGLNVLTINGETFLMILEDLNGTSNGRTPEGISNRFCEMYLLSTMKMGATVDDLVRVTAVPAGAEITGAIQISDNTVLANSQHPNATNPFPFNHSLTFAIHGWENLETTSLEAPTEEELARVKIYPNPTTRMVYLSETLDFAIYSAEGKRVKVARGKNQIDVSDLDAGVYYILTSDHESYKLIVQ
jgi:secreted PhoX family phosphatase